MRQHQIALEMFQFASGNAGLRQLAEAGVDAIDRIAGRQRVFDRLARAFDAWPCGIRQPNARAAASQSAPERQRRFSGIDNVAGHLSDKSPQRVTFRCPRDSPQALTRIAILTPAWAQGSVRPNRHS